MSSGRLFHFNWNPVPTYLEKGSILAVTMRDVNNLTSKAYRVGNERWHLEGGRVSGWW